MRKIISLFLTLTLILTLMSGICLIAEAADYTITVTASEGGTISPDSIVIVGENETQNFIITPEENYAIEYIKYNGIVVKSGILGATTYTTPEIKENSTLEVKFYIADSDITLLTSPLVFKGRKDAIDTNIYTFTFGRFTGDAADATDFGVTLRDKKYSLDADALAKAKLSGLFGIGLCDINNVLGETYEVAPYITKNGTDIIGTKTIINKNMENTYYKVATLSDVTLSAGTLYPNFNPEILSYEVYLPEDAVTVPSISCTPSVSEISCQINEASSLDGQTTITTTAMDGETKLTYTFNYIKKPIRSAEKTAVKGGFKTYNTASWTAIGTLPLSSYDLWLRAKTAVGPDKPYLGSSRIGYIEFDLSSLPDDAVLKSANLTLNVSSYASNQESLEIYANFCTEEDWLNYDVSTLTAPAYDVTKLLGTGTATGNGLINIPLDATQILSDKLVIALRREYIASEADNNTQIDVRSTLPTIEFEFYKRFNDDAKLSGVTVSSGNLSSTFDPNVFEYDIVVPSDITEVPTITCETSDNGATYQISEAETLNDPTIITVTANDGVTQLTYTFNFKSIKTTTITASKGGYKTYKNDYWVSIGTLPFDDTIVNKVLRLRSNAYNYTGSTSYISLIEFDLSSLPENYSLTSAELNLTIKSHSVTTNDPKIIANIGADDWESRSGNFPVYYENTELGKSSVSNGICSITLDISKISSSNKLVIELRREFFDTETANYTDIESQTVLPTLEIKYI